MRTLRAAGFEVTRLSDIAPQNTTDPDLLHLAVTRSMVLLTADKGFCDILRYPPASHRGIIVLRIDAASEPYVHATLIVLLSDHAPAALSGILAVVTAKKYRLRRA